MIRAYKYFLDFTASFAAAPPLPFHGATCESAVDYTKKKNVIRVSLLDGSEYLFMAPDQGDMSEWLRKMQFHAGQSPSSILHNSIIAFTYVSSSFYILFYLIFVIFCEVLNFIQSYEECSTLKY